MEKLENSRSLRSGMAGIIVTILVLSFLAIVLNSGISLVRTEIQAQTAGRYPDQARAAALSGIQFYMGCLLLASSTTFHADPRQRLHFLSQSTRNNTALASQQVATWTLIPPHSVYPNIATSTWLYPLTSPALSPPDAPDVPSSTLFILKTYAHDDGGVNLASYVYVKSLGCYREISGNDVIASHYAQVLGRILINKNTGELQLEKWRTMPVQYPSSAVASFHTDRPRPW